MCDLDRTGSKWDRIMALEDKVDNLDKKVDDLTASKTKKKKK